MRSGLSRILLCLALMVLPALNTAAQFRSEAFSQNYSNEEQQVDSSSLFSFKEYFGGLLHKNELKIGNMFAGSTLLVGGCQIYNKDYWKLPVVYGGLGATLGMGFHYKGIYDKSLEAYNAAFEADPETSLTPDAKAKKMMKLMFGGAAAVYWGTLMDGVISYAADEKPHHGKATLYSVLVPGLGQVYNGEGWKVPIYWGLMMGGITFWNRNQVNYERFRRIYIESSDPASGYSERITPETALYYRDIYRRYRDYSILATAAFYLLQVIDANVFSYMQNFEVNDDIGLKVSPTIITPDTQYALGPTGVGLRFGLSF